MSSKSTEPIVLLRSRAYVVSPGSPCPGTLEVTPSGVTFRADSAVWLFGGFGCRRDLSFPVECLKSASSSTWWDAVKRFWPGRLLVLEMWSGSRILFGVPQLTEWERGLRSFPRGVGACETLDEALSAITRSMLLDFGILGVASAACVGLGAAVGGPAAFGALAALLVARYAFRARFCRTCT